jgi:hypothetical protein
MERNNSASAIALLVGAFALSFFATVLVRKSAPAEAVAPSGWTGDAEIDARTREREESLAREVATLTLESRRFSEQLARKSHELSARVDKTRATDLGAVDRKAVSSLDRLTANSRNMIVRWKLRAAKEELNLTASQVAAYEASLGEPSEKDSRLLFEKDGGQPDDEDLVPLLDREQLAKYRERAKAQAESQATSKTQMIAALLGIPAAQAGQVTAILREEGVSGLSPEKRFLGRRGEARELLPNYAAGTDRARARLRPMLSPGAYEKLDRHLREEAESLKIFLEEIEKETKKD